MLIAVRWQSAVPVIELQIAATDNGYTGKALPP